MDPAVWFEAIVKYADAMRAAGVTHVKLEGCEISFAAVPPPAVVVDPEPGDALSDPVTYGGRVPGYPRPEG